MPRNNSRKRVCILITLCLMHSATLLQAQDAMEASDASRPLSLKKLSIEELFDVEVKSVSRKSEKLNEAASAIQVITDEEIRRSGVTSLPEALRLATNLQVAQVNSSQWAISARGFNNVLANKLLVMIDGRTVYTPLYAGVFWDVQNFLLEDIERIEVISGPGGTLWGSNAVNGVINIITKSARDTQSAFVEAGVGSELQTYGGLRYGGQISDKMYYRAYATGSRRGSVKGLDGNDIKDDWTMAQGGFQLDWDATDNSELSLQANVYDTRPNPDGNPAPIKARGQNILGRWIHSNSESSSFELQAYFDRTWRDFRNGFTERLNTYDIDAQHRFQIGKSHEIIWGLGARLMDHRVENLDFFRFEPANKTLHIFNLFLQDRITLIEERLNLTLGIKAERNRYTGMQYQPGARLAFTFQNNQILWAAVSRAVRTPSRIDRDFYVDATPEISLISGNDSFKSEGLVAYELGWRLQARSNLNLSVSTFYNRYSDLRSAEPGPLPLYVPIFFANGVEGETYGVEFTGTFQPFDRVRLVGGYTFLNKELSVKPTSQDLNGGNVESNDPKHQFLVKTMIDPSDKIELGFVTRYIDELPDPRVAAYWELDVRIAWKATRFLEFNIVGQNLLNDEHIEFTPEAPAAKFIERSIYGKVVCRF